MHALFDEWLKVAAHLGGRCVVQGHVIAGAESCTGGLIAAVLTSVSGSSAWVDRALVTYSNDAKIGLLGVDAKTLQAFGAVSEETAREMAIGALRQGDGVNGANIAYSVTGVAGPSGGSVAKPVGMVCFAFALRAGLHEQAGAPTAAAIATRTTTRHFAGDRNAVREQSVNFVLGELDRIVATGQV